MANRQCDLDRDRVDQWLLKGFGGIADMLEGRVEYDQAMRVTIIHELATRIEHLYDVVLPKLRKKGV